jgi:creatinase
MAQWAKDGAHILARRDDPPAGQSPPPYDAGNARRGAADLLSHLKLWEINCTIHRRGIELIRPGARCCDIAVELNEMYRQHDLLRYRSFGYGHSFGVLCHYYGREAGVELRKDIETVLKPDMVVSMEPMIMLPEGVPGAGGYREHDILVLSETGTENITGFPFGPAHNIVRAGKGRAA